MSLKVRLKDLRQTMRLSQQEMAELIEVTQPTISRLELRPSAPLTLPQYKILCEKFGEGTIEEFMDEEEEPSVVVSGNTNVGGNQNNGVFGDFDTISIMRKQAETIALLTNRTTEMLERLSNQLNEISSRI